MAAMTRQRKPEWSFQAWLDKFLHAVVLEPREIRGIDASGAHQANPATRHMAIARGCRPGTPDVLVCQGNPVRVLWIECKRPDGKGTTSDAQTATAASYAACGVPTVEDCRTIAQALDGLRAAGIRVSANTDTVARVYAEHVAASERARAAAAPVKRAAGKPRVRVPAAVIRRAHKARLWG